MLHRITITTVLLIVLALSGFVANASSTTPSAGGVFQEGGETTLNIQLIFDASGSMAGMIGDESRIDAARRTLDAVVDALPDDDPNLNVGFRVYGHLGDNTDAYREESCQSTELVVPMEGVDKEALREQTASYEPVGWTPIALALNEAAKDFPSGDNARNVIILVTDGDETCDGDPCAAAQALADSDAKVVVHVVGFGLESDVTSTLTCIPDATGGRYFDAQGGDALVDAVLSLISEEAQSTGHTFDYTGEARSIPILDDAFNFVSLTVGDKYTITYNTHYSFEDAVDFYRTNTREAGWVLIAENTSAPTVSFVFVGNGGQAAVVLTDIDESVEVDIAVNGVNIETSGSINISAGGEDVSIGGGEVNSEFPVLEDATNLVSSSGELVYDTSESFADVVEFYRTVPVEAGWTLADESIMEFTSIASMIFVRGDTTVDLSISPNPLTGGLLVSIVTSD